MKDSRLKWLIIGISVLVPSLVAFLMFGPQNTGEVNPLYFYLPHLNAMINAATALVLVLGLVLIKLGNEDAHKYAMIFAVASGTIFMVSYLIYHSSVPSTIYGDSDFNGVLDIGEKTDLGGSRSIYLAVLLTHIGLAIIVVPLVLLALFYALQGNFESHKKMVKFAFPIWLYVSVTGVVVYLMIKPYYL